MHSEFLKIIEYLGSRQVEVNILSNGERFSDDRFVDEFIDRCNVLNTTVVTTIHSSIPNVHEEQNGSHGSFARTVTGLNKIFMRGVRVVVKHCITRFNYMNTRDFIEFVDRTFHPSVSIQLWGLDYCGLSKEEAEELYVNYVEFGPYLESALDRYIEINNRNRRELSMHNIPLCWLDPFYWPLVEVRKGRYSTYMDPSTTLTDNSDDSGCFAQKCAGCNLNGICPGTYRTMFYYFGEDSVDKIEATLSRE